MAGAKAAADGAGKGWAGEVKRRKDGPKQAQDNLTRLATSVPGRRASWRPSPGCAARHERGPILQLPLGWPRCFVQSRVSGLKGARH